MGTRANPCNDCKDFEKCRSQKACRISLTTLQRNKRQHNYKLMARWKKRKGCAICKYNEHHAALHIDHINPATKSLKGKAWHPNWSKKRLKQELANCQVLCANCHFKRSYDENHYPR